MAELSVLPSHEIDRGRLAFAESAAQHGQHRGERSVPMLQQHPHWEHDEPGGARAAEFQDAIRPLGKKMGGAEPGRVHPGRMY